MYARKKSFAWNNTSIGVQLLGWVINCLSFISFSFSSLLSIPMNESKKQRKTKEEIVSILSQYEDVKCCGIRNKVCTFKFLIQLFFMLQRLSVAVPTFIFISSLFIAISSYIIEYEESFFVSPIQIYFWQICRYNADRKCDMFYFHFLHRFSNWSCMREF